MNTYSLESFISFCDDMMIAEENEMFPQFTNKKFGDDLNRQLDFILQGIEKTQNLKKKFEYMDKYIAILTAVKEDILNQIKNPSGSLKRKKGLVNILKKFIPFISTVMGVASVVYCTKNKDFDLIIDLIICSLSISGGSYSIGTLIDPQKREKGIQIILNDIETCIQTMKNLKLAYEDAIKQGAKTQDDITKNFIIQVNATDYKIEKV